MRVSTSVLQNSFGKYLKKAREGETVYIEKNHEPVAVLKGLSDEERLYLREDARAYRAKSRYSYKEFREIAERDENTCQYELIDGQIYMLAGPRVPHQRIVTVLLGMILSFFEDTPCSPFVAPLDVKLYGESACFEDNPNVVQPDILVMCDTENVDEDGIYQGIPSLVVEVLSPSTKSKDIIIKTHLYMTSGIHEYWVVDNEAHHLIINYFEERKLKDQKVYKTGEIACSSYFEGLVADTGKLFLS